MLNGITIIALVVTIIVLLILAGVAISLTVGQNGIMSRAMDASNRTVIANEKEAINLAYTACKIDDYQSNVSSTDLQNELNINKHDTTVTPMGNNLKVLFNETGHTYMIDQNGQVGELTKEDLKKIINIGQIDENTIYCELMDGTVSTATLPKYGGKITYDMISNNIITEAGIKQIFNSGFIDNDGKVYTYGNNECGQIGDGNYENKTLPICISNIEENALYNKKIIAVAQDYRNQTSLIAIDDLGKVYAWGEMVIGDGTENFEKNTPICISDIKESPLYGKTITKIYNAGIDWFAIDKDGKVYVWGINENGIFDNDSGEIITLPVCISDKEGSALNNVRIIDIVVDGTLIFIDENGKIYAFEKLNAEGYEPICINNLDECSFKGKKIKDVYVNRIDSSEMYALDYDGYLYAIRDNVCITTSKERGGDLYGIKIKKCL